MSTMNKQTKSKRNAGRKVTSMKKMVQKKGAKMKGTPKKAAVKTKASGKKITDGKTGNAFKRQVRGKSQSEDTVAELEGQGAQAVEESGDLQGLSNVAVADSESVDELREEGNAFEAEVISGVEDAGDAEEEEVRTHEVPGNDVPS
jgi:hypothetical protein